MNSDKARLQQDDNPIFLFGFERSGTTLLSMMIGAHPSIAVPYSVTGLWYRYGRLLPKFNYLKTRKDTENIVNSLLEEKRIKLWNVRISREEVLKNLELGDYSLIVARFHELYAQRFNKTLWANIDISTLYEMDVTYSWFPNARFIHIVRDGRDVALSHESYAYGISNTLECANQWMTDTKINIKMGNMLSENHYLIIRYEDLVLDTENTLERICSFIDIPYSSAMMDYPSMVESKVPKEKRFLWPSLDKPPQKSRVYRWKRAMSSSKRMVFEREAGQQLEKLGYETYDKTPKGILSYAYEQWCCFNRGNRIKRILDRLKFQN